MIPKYAAALNCSCRFTIPIAPYLAITRNSFGGYSICDELKVIGQLAGMLTRQKGKAVTTSPPAISLHYVFQRYVDLDTTRLLHRNRLCVVTPVNSLFYTQKSCDSSIILCIVCQQLGRRSNTHICVNSCYY